MIFYILYGVTESKETMKFNIKIRIQGLIKMRF